MAYLKGGTVVDGNLYVEGGLKVKQITDPSGKNLPTLYRADSSEPNRLVKFMDSDGALHYSHIQETDVGNIPEYKIINKDSETSTAYNELFFLMNDNYVCNVKFNNLSSGDPELVLNVYPTSKKGVVQTLTFKATGIVFTYSPDQINLADKEIFGFRAYVSGDTGSRYNKSGLYFIAANDGSYVQDSDYPTEFGYINS